MDLDLLNHATQQANSNSVVEVTAQSIIREYLSRKGLKATLRMMDEECPRSESSISNRQALMKQLNLEKLMKKNKESSVPLKTMLEIMAKYFVERRSSISCTPREPNGNLNDLSSNVSFPQTNEPNDSLTNKLSSQARSNPSMSRREKDTALVIDDDVEGESVIGEGKSGLFSPAQQATPYESPVSVPTKAQPNRPLSSRLRTTAIMSNDDDIKRRNHMMRPKAMGQSRLSVSQQRKVASGSPEYKSDTDGKTSNDIELGRSQRPTEDPPVSFEALLMKGTERANLLTRIGLDKKDETMADTSVEYRVETSSMSEEKSQPRGRIAASDSVVPSSSRLSDLEVGDLDDFETDLGNIQTSAPRVSVGPSKLTKIQIPSNPIDLKTAVALKNLVLGSPSAQYTDEWKFQAFSFCDLTNLKYCIVQKKGGPCGVLAAVQACVVQEMLYGQTKLSDTRNKNPTRPERSKLLAAAIANILWRAGDKTRAVVTLPGDSSHIISSSKFKQDDITEKLSLYTFTKFEELYSFLSQSISQLETDGCPGVILLMYSAILSRKPYQVRYDFDVQDTTLIASHGYCTQELVNLVLTGRAVSNTFNDSVTLDSGTSSGDSVTLKGLSGRSEVGFLSLFEHYKSCQVGTYYKTPKFPVWVVCSESHFSVLYSTRRDLVNDWKAERRFDLIYYDGLAQQQEEIRLSISTLNQSFKAPCGEDDLVPPLEHCIRTKWSDAEIDWNGYDPIL